MAAPSRNFRINIVGFLECNNGRTCDMHPYGCGNIMVLERPDNGVGMVLRLRMYVRNELAAYSLNPDGSDGCRVGFASREFAAGPNGVRFDGSLVRLITVYTADHENRTARRLFHHNRGYAVAEVIEKDDIVKKEDVKNRNDHDDLDVTCNLSSVAV